jgi:hypothetical protein
MSDTDIGKLVGKIVLEVYEKSGTEWYSKVTPVMLPHIDVRAYTKLALITAAVQQYMRDSLRFIDNILRTKEEIGELETQVHQSRTTKTTADVDKYQTKLPLKGV